MDNRANGHVAPTGQGKQLAEPVGPISRDHGQVKAPILAILASWAIILRDSHETL